METNTELSIRVNKDFPVTAEKLFNAWVSPDELKKWWYPMGYRLQDVKNDVREGGSFEYKYVDESGKLGLVIKGDYQEVKEKELLVYTWNWDLQSQSVGESLFRLTVKFTDAGDKSKLDVMQENLKDDEALLVHQQGWEKSLEQLKNYLAG